MTRQATDYTCCAAALQSVMAYYGDELREDVLSRLLKCNPKDGTKYSAMTKLAQERGYEVKVLSQCSIEKLKSTLDEGKPVICAIQAWPDKPGINFSNDWDDGHYVVAIGYDSSKIYFMDPSTLGNYTYIPEKEFLKRWHDVDGKTKLRNFGIVASKGRPKYDRREIKRLE